MYFVRSINKSPFSKLNHVVAHMLCAGTCLDVEFRNIKSCNLFDRTPGAFINSHPYSVCGIRIQAFNTTETIVILDSFENLLSFHLHTYTVFYVVFHVLIRQMNKAVMYF